MDIYHAASLIGVGVGSSFPAIIVPFALRRWMSASLASGALATLTFAIIVGLPQLRLAPASDAIVILGTATMLGLLFGLIAHGTWLARGPRDRGGWSSAKPNV